MSEESNNYLNWSFQKIHKFRKTVLNWYDQEGRDLPWRKSKNPYHIWVSEIMLQQTQVNTVLPYYERFITELPTIEDLSVCPEEKLHQLWQGLGYYSRVRNMQSAAKQIMTDYDGIMPSNMKDLLSLKGIGPYTAAAIGSIAFGLVEPAIDGNLMRITARLFEVEEDISQAKNRIVFKEILDRLIDPERPGDFNQALMDIGATIMTPNNYRPENHILKDFDQSYQNHTSHLYPVKRKKTKQIEQGWLAFVIQNEKGEILMRQHQTGELLVGLWHYPLVAFDLLSLKEASEARDAFVYTYLKHDQLVAESLTDQFRQYFIPQIDNLKATVKHVFSHRIWQVMIVPVNLKDSGYQLLEQLHVTDTSFQWVAKDEIEQLALSSLQVKLFDLANKVIR
ncbi:A/G-specific adenine glycosylase [Facklamia miroungae]|uniref:Adenine DNA glycosylase n=1 Tax=Facklamia miroungae TaxID=120956 RepID=A0A1G7QLT5_9LACT|nr:A/G-specific adenine glycosylase [Facklamia miroungae]NKZ28989.1 A/G-specific adenine glycosylase [Facklamia miroungae]SDF99511.1 A/G-specific adenine glycosylase [Facklamia miroungae]